MGEFEDKLNKILSSPEDMEKIMGLAKTLSVSSVEDKEQQAPGGREHDTGSSASPFGDIDPRMFKVMTKLMGEYSSRKNDKSELIRALKPYLREDRREQMDNAVKMAKLARIAKSAFSEFSGGDKNI